MRQRLFKILFLSTLLMAFFTSVYAVTTIETVEDLVGLQGKQLTGDYELVSGKVYDLDTIADGYVWDKSIARLGDTEGTPCSFNGNGATIKGKFSVPFIVDIMDNVSVSALNIKLSGDCAFNGSDRNGILCRVARKDVITDCAINGGGYVMTLVGEGSIFAATLAGTTLNRCCVFNIKVRFAPSTGPSAFTHYVTTSYPDGYPAFVSNSYIAAEVIENKAHGSSMVACQALDSVSFSKMYCSNDSGLPSVWSGNDTGVITAALDYMKTVEFITELNGGTGNWVIGPDGWPIPAECDVDPSDVTVIRTVQELIALQYQSPLVGNYKLLPGKVYDLDAEGCEWNKAIGRLGTTNGEKTFGNIDGNGATIRGKFTAPLFYDTFPGSSIRNLNIELTDDITFGPSHICILANKLRGTEISGCTINGGNHTCTMTEFTSEGGLLSSYLLGSTIKHCCIYNVNLNFTENSTCAGFVYSTQPFEEYTPHIINSYFAANSITTEPTSFLLPCIVTRVALGSEPVFSDFYYSDYSGIAAIIGGDKTGADGRTIDAMQSLMFLNELNGDSPEQIWTMSNGWAVPISSLPKGSVYCVIETPMGDEPLSIASLTYKGKVSPFTVDANTVITPSDFSVIAADDTQFEIASVSCNGSVIESFVSARDYPAGILFTAVVVNKDSEALKAACANHRSFYAQASASKIYTAESLAAYNEAIEAAENAKEINITKAECAGYMSAMDTKKSELELRSYTVTIVPVGCTIDGETEISGHSGDKLTITAVAASAAGKNVFKWYDTDNNVICTGDTLEYSITHNTILTVECTNISYSLTYMDSLGKVYDVVKAVNFEDITYPYPEDEGRGMRVGYTIKSWTNDYGQELPTEGAVDKDIVFTAQLVRDDNLNYEVKYYYGDSYMGSENLRMGKFFRNTAPETIDDASFVCWKNKETDAVLSYGSELVIPVYSAMEIVAVYGAAPEVIPTVVNIQAPVCDKGSSKISFTCQLLSGTDFKEELSHGAVLLQSDGAVESLDFDTPGAIVKQSSGLSAISKSYIMNAPMPVTVGERWCACAYVTYVNNDGLVVTVYSPVQSGILSE